MMELEEFMELMRQTREAKEELTKMDYVEYVTQQGKGDCVEELMQIRKNTILLKFEECNEENIPVGTSKSGGYPDLPPSISIPTLCGYTETSLSDGSVTHYNESAMQLVAQINLQEMAEYDKDNKLPRQGMLYFFWSGRIKLETSSYYKIDFEGENRELFKVIYYDGDMSLLKRTKPTCEYSTTACFDKVLDSYKIEAEKCTYMYDASKLEDIFYDEEDEEIAEQLYEDYENWIIDDNKLLGYAAGSMNVSRPKDDTIHLFQFDYNQGFLWGVYWFISEQALADRNFDKVYMDFDLS